LDGVHLLFVKFFDVDNVFFHFWKNLG
jgi:hypothetical protein